MLVVCDQAVAGARPRLAGRVLVYFPSILLILRMKLLFSFATGALSAAAYGSLGLVFFPPGTGRAFSTPSCRSSPSPPSSFSAAP